MLSIEKAIQYPFKDKNWMKTFGISFLIIFVVQSVYSLLSSVLRVQEIFQDTANSGDMFSQTFNTMSPVLTITVACGMLLVLAIMIPISIYMSGYGIDQTKEVMNGNEEIHPKHGMIMTRLKTGLGLFVYSLIYSFSILFLIGLALVPIFMTSVLQKGLGSSFVMMAWIFFGILVLAIFLFVVGILPIIVKSTTYLYITKGTIAAGLNVSDIMSVIKSSWKKLYVLLLVQIIAGIATSLSSLTCCFSFIVSPAITTIGMFSMAYADGIIFREISEGRGVAKTNTGPIIMAKTVKEIKPKTAKKIS